MTTSVSVGTLQEMCRTVIGEYMRSGINGGEARERLKDNLTSLFGDYMGHRLTEFERGRAFDWMASEIKRVKKSYCSAKNPSAVEKVQDSGYSLAPLKPEGGYTLTPEQSEEIKNACLEHVEKNCKYDYSDYSKRLEKLVLIYKNQGCEDAIGEVQRILKSRFGTYFWNRLDTTHRQEAINFLDCVIQRESLDSTSAEKYNTDNLSGEQRELIKSRARKMRRVKRDVKTPKDANYDALARDGYSHDQIVNMADDNGVIAKPIEHTSPTESRPAGEIRRMFRLPSPG